ncbi:MAG: hypothetical protein ABI168_01605 [Ginsengibacter sp.]
MNQRKPNRLKGYDYSQDDLYFITTCVKDMVCCFGDIVGTGRDLSGEPQMILNEYGRIAEHKWVWIGEQYPYINLNDFIVMPNHIHGIIEIDSVGTGRDLSIEKSDDDQLVNQKIKSISEIIGAYKMKVSKDIHLLGYPEFTWQRSFHDHIIRDQDDYERISHYIINNVNTWDNDRFRM